MTKLNLELVDRRFSLPLSVPIVIAQRNTRVSPGEIFRSLEWIVFYSIGLSRARVSVFMSCIIIRAAIVFELYDRSRTIRRLPMTARRLNRDASYQSEVKRPAGAQMDPPPLARRAKKAR